MCMLVVMMCFSEVIQLGTPFGVRNRTRLLLKSTEAIQIFNPTAILTNVQLIDLF